MDVKHCLCSVLLGNSPQHVCNTLSKPGGLVVLLYKFLLQFHSAFLQLRNLPLDPTVILLLLFSLRHYLRLWGQMRWIDGRRWQGVGLTMDKFQLFQCNQVGNIIEHQHTDWKF